MMPPHPDTFCDLQTMRYQELLAEAARIRRADEAAIGDGTPVIRLDRGRMVLRQALNRIVAASSTARFPRRLARAWS